MDQAKLDKLTIAPVEGDKFESTLKDSIKQNQDAVKGKVTGTVATGFIVDASAANLVEYEENNGKHKWIAVLIETGLDIAGNLTYESNGSTHKFGADDATEGNKLGGSSKGSFVLWVKAEDGKTTTKSVTLTTKTGATKKFNVDVVGLATSQLK